MSDPFYICPTHISWTPRAVRLKKAAGGGGARKEFLGGGGGASSPCLTPFTSASYLGLIWILVL